MWCQKTSMLLARNLFEIHAKPVNCSPYRWSVASIWACDPDLGNSILALVWQRALVCGRAHPTFSLSITLHWVTFINCMFLWKDASSLGFSVWPLLVCLAEFERKSADSYSHGLFTSTSCLFTTMDLNWGGYWDVDFMGRRTWRDGGRNGPKWLCPWRMRWKTQAMKYGISSVLSLFAVQTVLSKLLGSKY